jgi:cytoskeleton protein RodZ
MPTVGERLRQARDEAHLTLRDVSGRTKIPSWILADIERDDLSRIPGGIFTRGYLTSFARTVGLDGDAVWAHYKAETATSTVEPEPKAPVQPTVDRRVSPWIAAGLAAAVLVATVLWRNSGRVGADAGPLAPSEVRHTVSDVVPAAAPAQRAPTEVVPAVNTQSPGPATPAAVPLVLKIRATGEVWLDAKADGERRAYRLYTAGEEIDVDARNQIVLRVGDASAVTYTINGAPGRSLGGPGIVRDLVITPDDYTALVDRPR